MTHCEQDWDGCMISGIQDFTHPVFRCPIRSIKNRNSSQYFTNTGVNEVVSATYCPTNSIGATENFVGDEFVGFTFTFNDGGPVFGSNGEYELDPENNQCSFDGNNQAKLPVFGTCKNNCRGGMLKDNR